MDLLRANICSNSGSGEPGDCGLCSIALAERTRLGGCRGKKSHGGSPQLSTEQPTSSDSSGGGRRPASLPLIVFLGGGLEAGDSGGGCCFAVSAWAATRPPTMPSNRFSRSDAVLSSVDVRWDPLPLPGAGGVLRGHCLFGEWAAVSPLPAGCEPSAWLPPPPESTRRDSCRVTSSCTSRLHCVRISLQRSFKEPHTRSSTSWLHCALSPLNRSFKESKTRTSTSWLHCALSSVKRSSKEPSTRSSTSCSLDSMSAVSITRPA